MNEILNEMENNIKNEISNNGFNIERLDDITYECVEKFKNVVCNKVNEIIKDNVEVKKNAQNVERKMPQKNITLKNK